MYDYIIVYHLYCNDTAYTLNLALTSGIVAGAGFCHSNTDNSKSGTVSAAFGLFSHFVGNLRTKKTRPGRSGRVNQCIMR